LGERRLRLEQSAAGGHLVGEVEDVDDFEGPGYERVRTTVRTEGGDVEACHSVLALPGRLSAP
jgi:hypothetical protein